MKKHLIRLATISFLYILPFVFNYSTLKADNFLNLSSNEELKTGIVIQVNYLGFLGLSTVVVYDKETGALYLSNITPQEIQTGDTVTYAPPKTTKGNIIIRDIVRK